MRTNIPLKETFTLLTTTNSTKFVLSEERFLPGQSYTFKVRAKNLCMKAPFSTEIEYIHTALETSPAQIEQVHTISQACNVKISWIVPYDGGSTILAFIVEVRGKSFGVYHQLDQKICDQSASSFSCTVPKTVFA